MVHYFDKEQISQERVDTFSCTIGDHQFTFASASGMFSIGHIDKGTALLIQTAHPQPQHRVLDLGCGYGPVGIALAKQYKTSVVFIDTNTRALKYAKMNSKTNGVFAQSTFIDSNGYTALPNETFDLVLFNPPQHAGKLVCNALIEQTKHHLTPSGALHVVARHNKGGKSFETFMQETFGNVETLAKKSGFRVYRSTLTATQS